jgi:hypothetical protein
MLLVIGTGFGTGTEVFVGSLISYSHEKNISPSSLFLSVASYICVIECSDNHIYICDTKKVHLEELIPLRIIGLYNVEQNYTLYKVFKKPVSRHLTTLELDYSTTKTDIVETIISDRYFHSRDGGDYHNRKPGEWHKVRTGDVKQNRWMATVTKDYKERKKDSGYWASHRVSHLKADEVDDRPVCSHGYPCEVHFGSSEAYFDCPVKYIWPHFMPELARIRPCTFKQILNNSI